MPFVKKLDKFLDYVAKEEACSSPKFESLIDETVEVVQICTSIITFSAAPAFSLVFIILTLLLERQKTMISQRTIEKSMGRIYYAKRVEICVHLMIIFNVALIFLPLAWMQIRFTEII